MQREVQAVGDGQSDQRCDGGPQTEAQLQPEGADPVANLVPEGQFALAQFGLSPVHSLARTRRWCETDSVAIPFSGALAKKKHRRPRPASSWRGALRREADRPPVDALRLPEGGLGQHPRPIQGDVRAASAVRSKRGLLLFTTRTIAPRLWRTEDSPYQPNPKRDRRRQCDLNSVVSNARPSARSWACPIPTFCTRAFTLGSQRLQPTGILRMMTKPCFDFIARQVLN